MADLALLTGYVGLILISLFALAVLWQMFTGKIDLALLISEADGSASMSRFQLLIFTIVIAFGFVMVIVTTNKLPENIDPSVLGLLGLSGGTYLVSKGVQKSVETTPSPKDGTSSRWVRDDPN